MGERRELLALNEYAYRETMMRGGGKGDVGEDRRRAGFCMFRGISEQAGATKHTIRVAIETSITRVCRAIAARRVELICCS